MRYHEDEYTANRPNSAGPKFQVDSNLYIGGTALYLSVHWPGSLCNEECRRRSKAHPVARRQGSEVYALFVRSG